MTFTSHRRALTVAAGSIGLAIALSSCASAEESGAASAENTAGQAVASSEIDCSQFDEFGGKDALDGKEVEVYTTIVAPEDQPFIDTFAPFTECTGITVNYNGSKQFEAQLPVRVQSGDAPDIAFLPQPGLLQRMVATGAVAEPPASVTKNVDENWTAAWKEYGSVDGTFYAAPLGANVKSFVWYSPKAFSDAGYEIPKTWDELIALSDTMAADNPDVKPWCAGIGSDAATGWPATDWLEDTVLRQHGPDVYDQWIAHEIPFNDPRIVQSLDTVGQVLKNEEYVNGGLGGVTSIATTPFQDAGLPILQGQCMMHRQASFYQANWPDGTTVAEDGDVFAFPFPEFSAEVGQGIVGGGEFVAAFNDEPATQALQYYISTSDWANLKAKATGPGWFNANKGLDLDNLSSPIDRLAAEQLQDDSVTFRFDASDLMPAAIGSGAEWTQLTAWIAEGKSSQEVADAVEAAWPAS
ncbi:ABC transporter substrate-binding protein [Streptomyces sp. NP160]|uniref:ABC transporter substrate-binding protein n=1 Tax=Streptomyces sp. NP160 TaxID=2586637 RepID=UPI00214C7450|nr:ABC transporter substrate-binding protein [Streptomyces sp. NP160]